ncbi:MAG: hypothetical protein KDB94_10380 [Acidobacteria bacterium]|nr:hypothetical protein [Acidobacteriota bacterium]
MLAHLRRTVFALSLLADPAAAMRPVEAPRLPPPDPGTFTIVSVATAQELADACWNVASNTAIVVAPGTYELDSVAFPNGVDGRLTLGRFGAPPISNVQLRGATGDPADVVLLGAGMLDPSVPFGIQVFTATDVLIADLSVGEVYFHAVAIQGDQGAERVRLYHVRAFDAGQQIVKGSGSGADDVVIEFSEIFFTEGAVEHPEGSPPGSCYTNGIDATGGSRWIVRDNRIHDIRCQNGDLAGPAVLLWQGSSDSLVERNAFEDCSRGVSLGLVSGGDHSGGIVRDNTFRWHPGLTPGYAVDVPIYTVSPSSKILHNTALTYGHYPNAVEVRFAGTTGVEVRSNLLDGAVQPRDGGAPATSDNETAASLDWFLDATAGDLRLATAALPGVATALRLPDAPDDFARWTRPQSPELTEVGAFAAGLLFRSGFESGGPGAWSAAVGAAP